MFDDELNETYICSPVIRELESCIEGYFLLLEAGQDVMWEEVNVYGRLDGFFYYSECDIIFNEVEEMTRQHYNIVWSNFSRKPVKKPEN